MWAGGKSRLLKHYSPLLPTQINTYVEPFFGGGALFGALIEQYPDLNAVISDVNIEMMGIYNAIKNNPIEFERYLRVFADKYLSLSPAGRKEYYYECRKHYWAIQAGIEADALLYFLMKTCFNGIWQSCAEANGKFGTPVGLVDKRTYVYKPEQIKAWSSALRDTNILMGTYKQLPRYNDAFIYCDPPYRGSFTTYNTTFGDNEQTQLVRWCQERAKEGNVVWLANRDMGDGFFEKLAPEATIHRFDITYTAGRRKRTEDGFAALPAIEMLITWNSR